MSKRLQTVTQAAFIDPVSQSKSLYVCRLPDKIDPVLCVTDI